MEGDGRSSRSNQPPPKTGSARHRSRSTSSTGTGDRVRERANAPPQGTPVTPAAPQTGPAPRDAPPARTPAASSRGVLTDATPHRAARLTPSRPAVDAPLQATATDAAADTRSAPRAQEPAALAAKRPVRSPKSELESDFIIVHRLLKSNLISGDLAKTIAVSLNDRQSLLDAASTPNEEDEEELEAARNFAALTPIPQTAPTAALKRQRTETDLPPQAATSKQPRVAYITDEPLPQRDRDPRLRSRTTATPRVVTMDTTEEVQAQASRQPPPAQDNERPSTSFADAAKAPKRPADASNPPGSQPGGTNEASVPEKEKKKPRYPPLIVETLPTWAHHLRVLKSKLGRAPNARPFGKGIKFIPTEDQEYRLIQRYLTDLEKTESISWFSYSLPQDRSLKVAIRGIPVETDPEEIAEELRTMGFEPELVRPIKARQGRPGCIFFAVLKRTPNLIPAIYEVSELMCMPGVHIEAWRGKKGPSQCHRCQKFRHSSHGCHRQQACVRCGEEHSAHDCPRPREEPATCANCGGPHPANNLSCPVFRREARNKRAGTVAITTAARPKPHQTPTQTDEHKAANAPSTSAPATNIRTEANDPTPRGAKLKKKKKPKTRTSRPAPRASAPSASAPAPAPAPTTVPASAQPQAQSGTARRPAVAVEAAIQILSDVLLALRAGDDPVDVVLRGMGSLLKLNG